MPDDDNLLSDALGQIVALGDEPAPRAIQLGEAVKQTITRHPARPRPTTDDIPSEVVRALLDARNAIDAALAHLQRSYTTRTGQ